jgi:hypothetical protein
MPIHVYFFTNHVKTNSIACIKVGSVLFVYITLCVRNWQDQQLQYEERLKFIQYKNKSKLIKTELLVKVQSQL